MPDFIGGLAEGINKSKKLISKAVEGVANAMQMTLDSNIGLSLYGISSSMKTEILPERLSIITITAGR
ncbi:MAG: hypothetical protein J6B75_09210 [Ruminococcus sp.]|nr:hypothetical protein [Ruminococcus sp.]